MVYYGYIEREGAIMEWNDIYDKDKKPTGRVHRRGSAWRAGEYGLVVCVWVYDDQGRVLLTRRAPQKTFPGSWENSGGAAQAGETSRQAIARELYEETGIRASEDEFRFLDTDRYKNIHYDFYALKRNIPIEQVVLQPGETDGAEWATMERVHEMIRQQKICKMIARQFIRQKPMLLRLQKENAGK